MKLTPLSLAALVLSLAAGAAQAATYTFGGTLDGAPVFDRPIPLADMSLSSPSLVGVGVPYAAFAFSVTASGAYDFLSHAVEGWDNDSFLYAGSFDAAHPLEHALTGNEDFPNLGDTGDSGFSRTLSAGTTYVFVTTVFDNSFYGSFANSITGPGSVIPVPEPESWALMALGLGALGLLRRRSRR